MAYYDTNINILAKNILDLDTLASRLNSICVSQMGLKNQNITVQDFLHFGNIADKSRYSIFQIPKKKKGQFRTISSPDERLKVILRAINILLSSVYRPQFYVSGFVHGASVVTNAQLHVRQPFVYNIDLKHFFDSITDTMVIRRLQGYPYYFSQEVAESIANMSSISELNYTRPHLAQGSPASPVLSNLVCEELDAELYQLSNQFSVRYSRYADDITFSSSRNIFRHNGDFYRSLNQIVTKHSFEINPDKVRVRGKKQRQEVTGLTVNEKVNVTRNYVKDIRNLLYIWSKYGYGAAYCAFYRKYTKNFVPEHKPVPCFVDSLRGKLNYMALVKGHYDPTYLKLKQKFDILSSGDMENFRWDSYRRLSRFERNEGCVTFKLDKPETDKYGKSYYIATAPVSGGRIIISPNLTHLIDTKVDNITDILYKNCSVHQIFDKDGVKWVMAERLGEDIEGEVNSAIEEKRRKVEAERLRIQEEQKRKEAQNAEISRILHKDDIDDSINKSAYPYLVEGDALLDTDDFGFAHFYDYYYCRTMEDARLAFFEYFKTIAHVQFKPSEFSDHELFEGFEYSRYDDYSWSCKIIVR